MAKSSRYSLNLAPKQQDLSYLNRDLGKVILVDTNPDSCMLQPDNAIILPKWKGDAKDRGLVALIPFLECLVLPENSLS